MKWLMMIGIVIWSIAFANAQYPIPTNKTDHSCYRINETLVSCGLKGMDKDLNLNDDKVLDSLFDAGQKVKDEQYAISLDQGELYNKPIIGKSKGYKCLSNTVDNIIIVRNKKAAPELPI